MQLLDLAVAPYEPREAPTERRQEPRPSRARSDEVKDVHGLRVTLDRHYASALDLNIALGEVGRLPHGGVVHVEITPDRADHDFAGVQPYTDSYRDPVSPKRLLRVSFG